MVGQGIPWDSDKQNCNRHTYTTAPTSMVHGASWKRGAEILTARKSELDPETVSPRNSFTNKTMIVSTDMLMWETEQSN